MGRVAFLIARNIAITAPHSDVTAYDHLDFGDVPVSSGLRFAVRSTVYRLQNPRIDLVELETTSRTGQPLPPPLKIAQEAPQVGSRAALIGYPLDVQPPTVPMAVQKLILSGQDAIKRVQPGTVLGVDTVHDRITYDCFTQRGDGGGPLIDPRTGLVWGIHELPQSGDMNGKQGILLVEVFRNPELAKFLRQ